ncbi:hypothetical protein B0J11DRAFT_230852 [Dendryphion nanum]|uniref:Uncharacterized protein n=1 Tax=Dendryphion nanum TaxID=256645 RepID=A0A9P9E8I1_9PLEO|nr:hypothetical protein B0J11DRAFT_230852 [Dendryphion nanum]
MLTDTFQSSLILQRITWKKGFEMGCPRLEQGLPLSPKPPKINLSELNVWPKEGVFGAQGRTEQLHAELQTLASQLLSLLAVSLGKDADFFSPYLENSLSTLRLLHYPPVPQLQSEFQGRAHASRQDAYGQRGTVR